MLPGFAAELLKCNCLKGMIHRVVANDVLLEEVSALVAEDKQVRLKVKGCSMLPFIIGDKDSVLLVRPEALKVNDIALAYIGDGRYVLHRIIRMEGNMVILMGDGNLKGCERCRRSDIKAIAVRIYKNNGKEVDCASSCHLFLVKLWGLLKPLRRYLLAIYRRVLKINMC